MNPLLKVILPLAAIAVAATAAMAASHADKNTTAAIKARKGQMQLYAWNLGKLGAMAKGEAEYDAKAAMSHANNLNALVNLDTASMWPQGSDSSVYPVMTRAKLEGWSTWPAIAEKQKALVTAVATLTGEAGKGKAALGGALQKVGASCGGCHKEFRDEKK